MSELGTAGGGGEKKLFIRTTTYGKNSKKTSLVWRTAYIKERNQRINAKELGTCNILRNI